MNKCIIYKIILPDGMSYIGCTERSLSARVKEHKCHRYKKNTKLYLAMRKFKFDEIKFIVIDIVDNKKIYELEKFYIKAFDTHKNGLNDSDGGKGACGKKHNSSSINKRTKSLLKKKPRFFVENLKENKCHGLWENQLECSIALGIDHSYLSKLVKNKRTSPTWRVTTVGGMS